MKQAGLTFIELLIALAIVAVLAIFSAVGLHQLIRVDQHLSKVNNELSQLNIFMWRWQNDIEQLQMRRIVNESGTPEAYLVLKADSLSFTTARPINLNALQPGVDFMRVQYRLAGAKLQRITYGVVDRVVNTHSYTETLLNKVAAVQWKFMDSAHQWQTSWDAPEQLMHRPIAVDMLVTMQDGNKLEREILLTSPILAKRVENNASTN